MRWLCAANPTQFRPQVAVQLAFYVMKNLLTCSVAALLASCSSAAPKPPYQALEGVYFIWGDFAPAGRDSLEGFSVFLQGKPAMRLYHLMEEVPGHNECFDDGTLSKYQGNFECSKTPSGEYSCSFGVGLEDQKIYRGEPC